MKKCFMVVGLVALIGCAPSIPSYRPVDSNVKVSVRYFSLDESNANYGGQIQFSKQVAENIAALLQKDGVPAVALPATATVESPYVIDGTITKMDEGIWSLRFWIGFGAGAAKFEAESKIADATSGSVIGSYRKERISTSWLGSDDILQRVCLEVSEDITKKFRHTVKQ